MVGPGCLRAHQTFAADESCCVETIFLNKKLVAQCRYEQAMNCHRLLNVFINLLQTFQIMIKIGFQNN